MNDFLPPTNDDSLFEFNNDNRSHCFIITITNDNIYENNEDFFVELSLTPGSSEASVSIQPDEATVRIVDSDSEYTYIFVCVSVCLSHQSGVYDRDL